MNTKVLYIFIFIFLLAFQVACGQTKTVSNANTKTQVEDNDLRAENLKNQAAEVYEALDNNNFDKFAEFTHPSIIEKVGSKEKLISMMKKVAEMTSKNFESFSTSVENPTQIIEIDKSLYGVVPTKLEGITADKNKFVRFGSIVGISTDNGKNWKFVNSSKFSELFPNVADKVKIPEEKTFFNDKEQ